MICTAFGVEADYLNVPRKALLDAAKLVRCAG